MDTHSLKSLRGRWIMAASILASAMAFIDATALNVVLPALQKDLRADASELFWILNAYLLVLAALVLIGGALGDRFGRKKVLILGIAVFISGSIGCGFSPETFWLISLRVVQGFGGALMIPGSLALIAALIKKDEQGKAIGLWSACTTTIMVGGPILGGALADHGLWRYIFFINFPLGIAACLILLYRVSEDRSVDSKLEEKMDYGGALTIAGGLTAITFGFLNVPRYGLGNIWILSAFFIGALLTWFFILLEKRQKTPVMPLMLFKNRVFAATNLLTFLLYAALGAAMLFLSLNLVQIQKYSQLGSGLAFLPLTVLLIVLSGLVGKAADKHGARTFLIAGPAVAGAGFLLLSLVKQTNGPSDYFHSYFWGISILGLGMSLTVSPLTSTVMGSVNESLAGTASGINNSMTRIASVFANAVFGALAIAIFSGSVQTNSSNAGFSLMEIRRIESQSGQLGDAKVPPGMDQQKSDTVERIYKKSFIKAYQLILRICTLLAWLAATIAIFMIKPPTNKSS